MLSQTFKLFTLMLASALIANAQQAAQQSLPEWRAFTSQAGAFTAKFPGTPVIGTDPMTKGPVKFTRNTHLLTTANGYFFEIDYIDLPAGYNQPDLSLEGGISGLVASMSARGGRVLTRETIMHNACEGREATLSVPDEAGGGRQLFAQARIFNSGQRYYFLMFLGGAGDNPAVRQAGSYFMASFSVTGGCSSALAPTVAPSGEVERSTIEGTLDAQTGWRKIDSQPGGFSILLPGVAQVESEQQQLQPFPLSHRTYIHENDSSFYSAEVIGDYPPNFHNNQNAYEVALDLLLYAMKKTLEPSGFSFTLARKLNLGSFPGREYTVTISQFNGQGRAQIFVTPKRSYVFLAFGKEKTAAQNFERFFSSIRIVAK